jgi:hypothetical protein
VAVQWEKGVEGGRWYVPLALRPTVNGLEVRQQSYKDNVSLNEHSKRLRKSDLLPTASLRPATLPLVSSAVEVVSRQTVYRILDIDPRPTVSLTGELFKIDCVTIVCLCLSRRHCCFLRLGSQPERMAIFRCSLGG